MYVFSLITLLEVFAQFLNFPFYFSCWNTFSSNSFRDYAWEINHLSPIESTSFLKFDLNVRRKLDNKIRNLF